MGIFGVKRASDESFCPSTLYCARPPWCRRRKKTWEIRSFPSIDGVLAPKLSYGACNQARQLYGAKSTVCTVQYYEDPDTGNAKKAPLILFFPPPCYRTSDGSLFWAIVAFGVSTRKPI